MGGAFRGGVNPTLIAALFTLRERDGLTGQSLDLAKLGADFSKAQKAVMGERAILQG